MAIKGITKTTHYLTFKLDREVYALEIKQVREVLDFIEITRVPGMPSFTRGIINLRGNVVPVVDLKLKFDMPETLNTVDTCIIILDFVIDREPVLIGILADSVQEVLSLEPDQLEPVSKMGSRLKSEFIKGIGKKDKHFIIILDLDKVFSTGEIEEVVGVENLSLPEDETQKAETLESELKENDL